MVKMCGKFMTKAYLFAVMLLFVPFTGCLETEESEPSLRESFDGLISAINANDNKKLCSYILDYDGNFLTGTEKEECEYQSEEEQEMYNEAEWKTVPNNYSAEKQDYKASPSSGYVYIITVDFEDCWRENSTQSWDCEKYYSYTMPWAKVDGRWGWGWEGFEGYYEDLDIGESAPITTFMVEQNSGGFWQVEVIKVSQQKDLESFSFYLKDGSGSTYVGHSQAGFGEIAMQIKDGEEMGIDSCYSGNDQSLESRATNVSNDDGSVYPVHFCDNDSDGKLSAGDYFFVYGQGNSANGPAEEGWKLDLKFDATGDTIGSAKLQ